MENREQEQGQNEDMFDEMSVVELEERLELVNRCLCRNDELPSEA